MNEEWCLGLSPPHLALTGGAQVVHSMARKSESNCVYLAPLPSLGSEQQGPGLPACPEVPAEVSLVLRQSRSPASALTDHRSLAVYPHALSSLSSYQPAPYAGIRARQPSWNWGVGRRGAP